jgi:bud emergence protein 1
LDCLPLCSLSAQFSPYFARSRRFVAKPIGRLGGPGLIPVAFVEIRDPVTSRPIENVAEILAQGQVQRIEEWKSATARYKESSIPLGTLGDFRNVGMEVPQPQQAGHDSATQPGALVNGDVISTHVKSFHYEANAYWFRINALFLPDDPSAPAVSLVLYRLYEDFYNFQITLLDLFPREAGRTTRTSDPSARDRRSGYQGTGRILPYMPGPCDRVDVDITNERRKDLDLYLYELLELRSQGAGYILRHEHVLGFFTPGSGDMTDTIDREEARVIARQVAEAGAAAKRTAIAETMSRGSSMRQSRTEDPRASGLSQRLSGLRFSDGNHAARSSSSMGHSQQSHGPSGSITRIPGASATSPVQRNNLPQTASTTTSFSRAGPPSNTTHAPSQSANAPQPAYIKIKILDRHTDDMVAIRVPPRVTYDQLLDKVRDRLGVEISVLQYRVGQGRIPGTEPDVNEGQEFGDVRDDSSLWDWLEAHEKYVLYAE